ncbi:hypothetical protein [Methylobacterium sp. XJLW]|uniref:hypothetical protein n=1 Tax=Methylobacterium sp. XJLW TaxID=739141 RepID=UPI0013DFBF6F|nr:hypothetical protein [Methylobacterium sp. XJLW]
MMFWLGFFVGLGASSFIALLVATAMSFAPTGEEEDEPLASGFDLLEPELGQ